MFIRRTLGLGIKMKINGKILLGDVRKTIRRINKGSVQMIVTSPPYWRLRDYGDGEEDDKQIGLEPTPEEYTQNLVEVFRLCKRVLRPDGTLWLNLGDCYMGTEHKGKKHPTIKAGELVGIPWMVAQALSLDGWYLRCPIIWHKTSSMPTSVKNRPGLNHEYIFLMSKQKSYYYDPFADKSATNNMLRSVWKMGTTKEKNIKHFATFPVELPIRCIKLGTSEKGCCTACGTPYSRKMKEVKKDVKVDKKALLKKKQDRGILGGDDCGLKKPPIYRETVGWKKECDCDTDEVMPCRVLDIFMGSGTTAVAAEKLKRRWIGTELYPKNKEMAINRIKSFLVGADYIPEERIKAIKKVGFGLSRRC